MGVKRIFILILCVYFFFIAISYGRQIYHLEENDPYFILEKATTAYLTTDSVILAIESWMQTPFYHIKLKLSQFVEHLDNIKVEGRSSFSSIHADLPFSSSQWIQYYMLQGIPFRWDAVKREWKKELLSLQDPQTRQQIAYSMLQSLYTINEQQIEPSSLVFKGEENKDGYECFVIEYCYIPESFKQWEMFGQVHATIWIDRNSYQPRRLRAEGKLGELTLLQVVTYSNYNQPLDFKVPETIQELIREERNDINKKLNDIMNAVAVLRGWKPGLNCSAQFVSRSQMYKIMEKEFDRFYSEEKLAWESFLFKWLGLVPLPADYREFSLNSQILGIGGLYVPEDKTIYVGEWLDPSIAEVVFAHEAVHAYQDYYWDLNNFLNPQIENYDISFTKRSLVEGEAFAVGLEYLLQLDGESFINLEDIDTIIQHRLLSYSFSRDKILYTVYGLGTRFIQEFLHRYPWEELDSLYENEPVSMAEIMYPENYFLRKDFQTISQYPTGPAKEGSDSVSGWTKKWSSVLGKYLIYSAFSQSAKDDEMQELIRFHRGDGISVYENVDKKIFLYFYTIWEGEEEAIRFFKILNQWILDRDTTVIEEDDLRVQYFGEKRKEKFLVVRNGSGVNVFWSPMLEWDDLNQVSESL